MSKIGKNPIVIPNDVEIIINGSLINIKGPKGSLSFDVSSGIFVSNVDNFLHVACDDVNLWNIRGTTRAILAHMIEGVHTGYTRILQVIGVGFDAVLKGKEIQLKLGFSHPVFFSLPDGVEATIDKNPKGNSIITLLSHDKQLIGQTAAKIRDLKRPEPYKGKGIRYADEIVKLKAGKTAKK